MWTVKIISKEKKLGRAFFVVEFTNGTETFAETIEARTAAELKTRMRAKIADFEAAYSLADATDPNTTLDLAVAPPTQAETEFQTFVLDWRKYQKVKVLIDHGILTGNEAPVTSLKTKVINGFKAAYIDQI